MDKPRIPRVGSIVEVQFEDHAHGSELKPFRCMIWGRLVRADRKCIVVRHWESSEGEVRSGNNHEESLILRNVITGARKL